MFQLHHLTRMGTNLGMSTVGERKKEGGRRSAVGGKSGNDMAMANDRKIGRGEKKRSDGKENMIECLVAAAPTHPCMLQSNDMISLFIISSINIVGIFGVTVRSDLVMSRYRHRLHHPPWVLQTWEVYQSHRDPCLRFKLRTIRHLMVTVRTVRMAHILEEKMMLWRYVVLCHTNKWERWWCELSSL